MKKIGPKLFMLAVSLLLLLANIASASACGVAQYQPEIPQVLRK